MALVAPKEKTFWVLLAAGRVPGGGQTILSDRRADGHTDGRTNGRTDGRAAKKKGRALLLYTAVPKVLQEFLPEFRSSLDACKKKEVPCPAVPAPKGTVAVWAAGLLDIYK